MDDYRRKIAENIRIKNQISEQNKLNQRKKGIDVVELMNQIEEENEKELLLKSQKNIL